MKLINTQDKKEKLLLQQEKKFWPFFGCVIIMGLVKQKSTKDYFSENPITNHPKLTKNCPANNN